MIRAEGHRRPTISVFGLGRMGLPIAMRLAAAGHDVRGWDIDASRRAAAADAGVTSAASPTDAVRDPTSVPTDPARNPTPNPTDPARNPAAVPPDALRDIRVLVTVLPGAPEVAALLGAGGAGGGADADAGADAGERVGGGSRRGADRGRGDADGGDSDSTSTSANSDGRKPDGSSGSDGAVSDPTIGDAGRRDSNPDGAGSNGNGTSDVTSDGRDPGGSSRSGGTVSTGTVSGGGTVSTGTVSGGGADSSGEFIDALSPGAVWLDLTSNDPRVAEAVARRLAARGIASVAAPMRGGPAAAASASLGFTVSGDPAAIESVRPLLAALGDPDPVVVGDRVGQAHTLKLAGNAAWFGQLLAITEALQLAVAAGIPPRAALDALRAGPTASALLDEWAPRLLDGDTAPDFGLDRVVEELEALVAIARAAGIEAPVASVTAATHREALAHYGAVDGELLGAAHLQRASGVRLDGR
ncbi:NAD(P)-binding domain-containing protein [Galbitalea sp. SE-J8]|uniref:NAD(P)-binding domain-containing protein n=1 Tax=Galbitalea sp. SE-J8 TaxID=3054952 RepID=UPI00259CB3EA|nr:NAD(P)-binding domain-containing protein [Galbitalea sp. SE-J8]MDM4763363.1 NAD(P)-binding domain-containing protein [Galbitalea sp. SE-J8]